MEALRFKIVMGRGHSVWLWGLMCTGGSITVESPVKDSLSK